MDEGYGKLLKNRNFILLWLSQMLSQFTIHILNFTFLIRLFNLTGSTIATSLLWIAYALPAIIIGPFAAAAVDVFNKKRMLMLTNLAQSLSVFFYALFNHPSFFVIYGIAILYSFLNQFYVPAELASLPAIVKRQRLSNANGLFFLTQQGAIIIGFGVAGFLNNVIGYTNTIYMGSGALFLAFLSVGFLPGMNSKTVRRGKFDQIFSNFFSEIYEGYHYIKNRKDILLPFFLLMGIQVGLAVVVVNVPVIAKEIFRVGLHLAGVLVVVPAGLGAGTAALFMPRILKKKWRKKKMIEVSLFTLFIIFTFFSQILPKMTLDLRVFLGFLAVIGAGFSFVGVLIPSQTYLQEKTPERLRGRVFGNLWFVVTVATVFPVIFSGALTDILGVRYLIMILSVVVLVGFIMSSRYGQKLLEGR